MNTDTTRWYIWSMEHNAFWAPARNGYTRRRDSAGTYSYAEATEIVRNANYGTDANLPHEAMILAESVLRL